jgi:lambda family phage portal protein
VPLLDQLQSRLQKISGFFSPTKPSAASQGQDLSVRSQGERNLRSWTPAQLPGNAYALQDQAVIRGRAQQLYATNGNVKGAIDYIVDRMVGYDYRLMLSPAAADLGIDKKLAKEWARSVERKWREYANNTHNIIDAERKLNFTGLLRQSAKAELLYGESIYTREWRNAGNLTNTPASTCFLAVDPARIGLASSMWSSLTIAGIDGKPVIGGVELDAYGAAVAYHIAKPQQPGQQSPYAAQTSQSFDRITRYNAFGWQQIIHIFDPAFCGQTRGLSRLAPVIERMKMLDMFEGYELQQAQLAALFAFYLSSDYPPENVLQAFGADQAQAFQTSMLASKAAAVANPLSIDGAIIPHLYPGEKVETVAHNAPNANSPSFKASVQRNAATGLGLTYAAFSGDDTGTSYASARIGIEREQSTLDSRRASLIDPLATQMFTLWLREQIVRGNITPPAGLDYWANEAALTTLSWVGPAMPQIDPVKSATADEIRLSNGTTTLAEVCGKNGQDWEEVLDQQRDEQAYRLSIGLPQPAYQAGQAATQAQLSNPNNT